MIIDASKMNADGYNKGSAIGAAVSTLIQHQDENSFWVDQMIADSTRVIDFHTTKDLLISASKDMDIKIKIETVNDTSGWSRRLVVHYL